MTSVGRMLGVAEVIIWRAMIFKLSDSFFSVCLYWDAVPVPLQVIQAASLDEWSLF